MARRNEESESKDSSTKKPISDMDPEGMDSELEGDGDLDSSQSAGADDDTEFEDEEDADAPEPQPGHNRRESDRKGTQTSGDRER